MQFFALRSVAEARQLLLAAAPAGPLGTEEVDLDAALDRVLAADMVAIEDLPGFARSTVDGYAVRAADTFGASEGLPAYLRLVGEIPMGVAAAGSLGVGEAMGIATGGMLPAAADAIVMLEHTEPLAAAEIGVLRPVAPGENVIRRAEDAAAGSVLVPRGKRLRPQELGALAQAGMLRVPVARRVRCAVISTGDELVDPAEQPALGKVRDTNKTALLAAIRRAGAEPLCGGRVGDTAAAIRTALQAGLATADVVLISGGSSVGTRDLTAKLIQEMGEPGILVHGVRLKPGKPTILALVDRVPVLGLPGHPVSAQVVFELFVAPLLDHLHGLAGGVGHGRTARARLTKNVASATGRTDCVRVQLHSADGEVWAEPVHGKSGLLSTLVRADGLVLIADACEGLVAGETVIVHLI